MLFMNECNVLPIDLVLKWKLIKIVFAAGHTLFYPRRVNFDEIQVHRKYSPWILCFTYRNTLRGGREFSKDIFSPTFALD